MIKYKNQIQVVMPQTVQRHISTKRQSVPRNGEGVLLLTFASNTGMIIKTFEHFLSTLLVGGSKRGRKQHLKSGGQDSRNFPPIL